MTRTGHHATDLYALFSEEDPEHLQDLLEMVTSLSGLFAATLDIQETMRVCVGAVRSITQTEATALFLLDENGQLVCQACSGCVNITGLTIRDHQGVVGRTVRERQPQMVQDAQSDPEFADHVDICTGFVTESLLTAPLRVGEEILGVLEIINKRGGDGRFRPKDRAVVGALANSVGLAIHNARQAVQLLEQERLQQELALARTVQESFLPPSLPPEFPIHGISTPSREISGDFFEIVERPDGRLFFALGDVSGKGINAGLLMAKTSSLLHYLGTRRESPGEILAEVNQELQGSARMGMFVTLVAGVLDMAGGTLTLTNGGHTPPLLCKRDEGTFHLLTGGELPLGISGELHFPDRTIPLRGCDLYLYSDGLTEAPGERPGEYLGESGLMQLAHRFRQLPGPERISAMLAAVQQGPQPPHDDITLLLVQGPEPSAPQG